MLKLIHTADWHLGHSLHGVSREYEHARFLGWFLEQLEAREADALIVAGDIFDSANPPASAQAMLYRFLSDAKRCRPDLDIIIIAGNHDSGSRLAAPSPVLGAFGVQVIGGLPKDAGQEIEWESLCFPLRDSRGEVAAWCGAMPFLRNADLPVGIATDADPLIEGVRQRYRELFEALRLQSDARLPLLATGHCYMTGTQLSELSERKILGGNQHALPGDIFPDDTAYAALGHLHKAQRVGGQEHIRYSGSPIPLSLDEESYRHQVLEVVLDASLVSVTPLEIPRVVQIMRLPEEGPAGMDEIIRLLSELSLDETLEPECHPYLEVRVLLEQPEPGLRQRIDEALSGRPVRLLKVTTSYTGSGSVLAEAADSASQLESLSPDEVFARRYAQLHAGEPPSELAEAFSGIVESVMEVE